MIIIIIILIIITKKQKKNKGVAGHNNHNKIHCDYICSLRAVKFLVTIVMNFF